MTRTVENIDEHERPYLSFGIYFLAGVAGLLSFPVTIHNVHSLNIFPPKIEYQMSTLPISFDTRYNLFVTYSLPIAISLAPP